MLGRLLSFGFLCLLLSCNGLSFEEEATTLLKAQGIDLSELAAGSTTTERKNSLKTALTLVRNQLAQQVTDVQADYNKREAARLGVRNAKLAQASQAKVQYDSALDTYKKLLDLSNKADTTYKTEREDDLEETNRLNTNIDGVIRIILGLLNGQSVTWTYLGGWTGWVNGWDGPLSQGTDSQSAFCGFSGVHDNNREDRIFRLLRCRPVASGLLTPFVSNQQQFRLPTTGYRQAWVRECPINQYIGTMYSVHHNGYEDRIWTFTCKSFDRLLTDSCTWTGWLSGYDGGFTAACPGSRAIAGFRGAYSTGHRDRIFAIKCCGGKRKGI